MSKEPKAHDLSAEHALLGLLLQRPDALLPECRARLRAADFFSVHHALIYQAALDLEEGGQSVSLSSVFASLEADPDKGLSAGELADYRVLLERSAADAPELRPLLDRVLTRARSRDLERALERLRQDLRTYPEALAVHVEQALGQLLPLARDLGSLATPDLSALLAGASAKRRRPSGWDSLDANDLWFGPGELALVLGRTGHGKTFFTLNLLLHWLEQSPEERFVFYSLEMTAEQVAQRLAKMRPGLAGEELAKRLSVVYCPRWDAARLVADALRRLARSSAGGIFVDSATALAPPPGAKAPQRRDLELAEVCRRLKDMAVALACPVVATVPASREGLKEEGAKLRQLLARGAEFHEVDVEDIIRSRRPRLEHLPEPGLEQHADLVIGLLSHLADYQEELDPEHRLVFKARPTAPIEVNALKHRGGPLHGVELDMEARTGVIRSLAT